MHLGLEELAERLAVDEWLAGRVLGRVVVNHLVVRTVHLLELFDQDGEIVSSNSPCAEGLLSNGADVSQHNVRIGEKLSIEEEEVCSPQSLASSMVVGIDAEIRKQRILVRNPGKDVSEDPYWMLIAMQLGLIASDQCIHRLFFMHTCSYVILMHTMQYVTWEVAAHTVTTTVYIYLGSWQFGSHATTG